MPPRKSPFEVGGRFFIAGCLGRIAAIISLSAALSTAAAADRVIDSTKAGVVVDVWPGGGCDALVTKHIRRAKMRAMKRLFILSCLALLCTSTLAFAYEPPASRRAKYNFNPGWKLLVG